MKRYKVFYPMVLLVSDFVAILAAFMLAFFARVNWHIFGSQYTSNIDSGAYLTVLLLAVPVWLVIFASLNLYSPRVYEKKSKEWIRLLLGCLYGVLFLIGCDFMLGHVIFKARLIAVYGFIFAFCLLLIERIIVRASRQLLFRYGFGVSRVLVIGSGKVADEIVSSLKDTAHSGYKIVALVGRLRHYPANVSKFRSVEQALDKIDILEVDTIIQTELYDNPALNSLIASVAQANHVHYKFVPAGDEFSTANNQLDLIGNLPVISVHQTRLLSWGSIEKRLFDVIFSLFAIIVTSPISLVVMLILKISEPEAPIIFKQKRVSRYGKEKVIYKFRTLQGKYNGKDAVRIFEKLGRTDLLERIDNGETQFENDPRLSKFGKAIRQFSIDELPQLYNVLRGDISLVGPRAIVKNELSNYQKLAPIRQTIRSGITGLAQVSGRSNLPFDQRLELDIYYVQNWSFWLDIVIIARTVYSVFRRSGAR